MPSTTVINIQTAKAEFDRLLDCVSRGEEIVITADDKPLAKLSPISAKRKPLPYGLLKGKLVPHANFD